MQFVFFGIIHCILLNIFKFINFHFAVVGKGKFWTDFHWDFHWDFYHFQKYFKWRKKCTVMSTKSFSLNNLSQIVRLVVLMKEYMRIYGRLTVNSFALRVDNNGEEENIGTGFIIFYYKKNGIVSILGRELFFNFFLF